MKNKNYKRIVIKIGSSSLTHQGGKLNLGRIDHFLRQMVDLKNQGRDILFVSSGAIAAGMAELALKEKPQSIPEQQGMAAIGQAQLMALYNKFLAEYSTTAAQILLTSSDLEDRHRYLNAYNTMKSLLKNGVIPIINENDTIATQEIKFGDNDTLSARVAGLMEADLLIILSDIEGFYNGDPRIEKDLKVIRKIENITEKIEGLAGGKGSNIGTGGMHTKLEAAKIAVNSGITMVIGPGQEKNIILDIVEMIEEGKEHLLGTTFLPRQDFLTKKKHWLLYNPIVCGSIKIDIGAENALLERGKSLLPGGIIQVSGDFEENDPVSVLNINNKEIAKGLVNYSAKDISRIKGQRSVKIKEILGYFNRDDVIHRDNMVIKKDSLSKGGEENEY